MLSSFKRLNMSAIHATLAIQWPSSRCLYRWWLFWLNTLASGWNRGFSTKKHRNAHGFAQEFLRSGQRYRLGQKLKRHGESCSLHSKKIFWLRGADFS